VVNLLKTLSPSVVLTGATSQGRDVAAAVAAAMGVGVANDINGLMADGGSFKATRPIFGGNAIANLTSTAGKLFVATVIPKSFEKAVAGGSGEVAAFAGLSTESKTQIQQFVEEVSSGKLDMTEAEVVVVGGRGVGSGEKFAIIEELARALGAAVGASRAVTDAGWRPNNEQVGQTGRTIKPKLYIGAGVSGAVQHWVGMKESGYIVAINTDADAPIMKMADVAIVGDLFAVIPEMIKQVSAAKGAAV
jgi:electron transfer flavoprotein alpha subunit